MLSEKIGIANMMKNVITVDVAINGTRELSSIQKTCDKCGQKNHFRMVCRSSEGSMSESSHDSRKRSDRAKRNNCTHRCNIHEINGDCHDDNSVEDLVDQVQSLFYN